MQGFFGDFKRSDNPLGQLNGAGFFLHAEKDGKPGAKTDNKQGGQQ